LLAPIYPIQFHAIKRFLKIDRIMEEHFHDEYDEALTGQLLKNFNLPGNPVIREDMDRSILDFRRQRLSAVEKSQDLPHSSSCSYGDMTPLRNTAKLLCQNPKYHYSSRKSAKNILLKECLCG